MKYVSTYLMLVLGGNDSPSAADVTAALEKVGVDVDAAEAKKQAQQEEASKKASKKKQQQEKEAAAWTKGPCPKSMDCWGVDAAADVCIKCTEAQEQEYEDELGPEGQRAKVKPGYGSSGGLQGIKGPGGSGGER